MQNQLHYKLPRQWARVVKTKDLNYAPNPGEVAVDNERRKLARIRQVLRSSKEG